MLDVKGDKRRLRLLEPAVFTPVGGALADEATGRQSHHAFLSDETRARALAWRMAITSNART